MDVWQILRKKFPENEYALMAEVSDASGFSRSRSADYIAVNLWPSRGLAVNGIELKSSRGDWLNELKNPKKAENIFKYCDFFWLLTKDETIAMIEEIPASWGWICIKNEKVFTKKDAPKLTPVDITRHFLCAMLKRASDKTNFVHIDSIQDRISEAVERTKIDRQYKFQNIEKELAELNKRVHDFKTASGIDLSYRWENAEKIGEAVKFVQSGGISNIEKELEGLKRTTESILYDIEKSLKIYEHSTNSVEFSAAME